MGFLDRLGASTVERRNDPSDERWWGPISDFVSGTGSGVSVTPESAIEGTVAVYAAVGIRAEQVGTLPLHLYTDAADGRDRVSPSLTSPEGRISRMLHEAPNPELTAQEYWDMVEGHTMLWGNHYSYIRRDGGGRPQELWPLHPGMMDVTRDRDARGLPVGGRRYVYVLPSGERRGFGRSEILHVMDRTNDGIKGMSRIEVARNGIGVMQAAGEYAARFYSNSARPDGILSTDQALSDEATSRLRTQWENLHRGLTKAQRVGILHSGLSWQAVGVPPKDAQFIETRRFELEEIARMYRVPLHLLGDTSQATTWGTGVEQMTIGFVVYTLRSGLKRIEAAISRDLGDPDLGRTLADVGLKPEFSVEGLLRGDMAARAEFYSKGLNDGWLTGNDPRRLENLKPLPGLDRVRIPLNYALIDESGDVVPVQPPREGPAGMLDRVSAAYEQHLAELTGGTR